MTLVFIEEVLAVKESYTACEDASLWCIVSSHIREIVHGSDMWTPCWYACIVALSQAGWILTKHVWPWSNTCRFLKNCYAAPTVNCKNAVHTKRPTAHDMVAHSSPSHFTLWYIVHLLVMTLLTQKKSNLNL
jgi:hypothetical protein